MSLRNTATIVFVSLYISCCNDKGSQTSDSKVVPNASDHLILGPKVAKQQMEDVLKLYSDKPFSKSPLITDSVMAVAIVEPILFQEYGEELILEQRPYEVYLFDSLWYISGTIPKGMKGGGFEIIIDSRNARVLSLLHYK